MTGVGSVVRDERTVVSNGPGGRNFFGEMCTGPKSVGFGEVASAGMAWKPDGSALM